MAVLKQSCRTKLHYNTKKNSERCSDMQYAYLYIVYMRVRRAQVTLGQNLPNNYLIMSLYSYRDMIAIRSKKFSHFICGDIHQMYYFISSVTGTEQLLKDRQWKNKIKPTWH